MRSVPKTRDIILRLNQFGYMEYNHQVIAMLQTDHNDFEKKVKEALARDQIAQNIQENLDNKEDFEEQDGILTYQKLLYVPFFCQKKLVNKFYGAQPHGHQGSAKTLERISQTYYLSHIQRFVKDVL